MLDHLTMPNRRGYVLPVEPALSHTILSMRQDLDESLFPEGSYAFDRSSITQWSIFHAPRLSRHALQLHLAKWIQESKAVLIIYQAFFLPGTDTVPSRNGVDPLVAETEKPLFSRGFTKGGLTETSRRSNDSLAESETWVGSAGQEQCRVNGNTQVGNDCRST
jgi:hypothetical protein